MAYRELKIAGSVSDHTTIAYPMHWMGFNVPVINLNSAHGPVIQ